uniref:Uncharacterized protein n=1 Tax=Bracon brevicornis TaxID=1563983 RepID=A0A6V7J322_9HYME
MVDDIRTDLRGQTGDETVHENQRPIDERRQVRDNRRVLRDGEGGSQGDIGGVTLGQNTTTIGVELVEYFRANQTKGIPTFSGRPDFSTDFLDFGNAVKQCYHRVSPFNADFVGAVLDQLRPPARAHLEKRTVHSVDEILQILGNKYRPRHSQGYYERKIADLRPEKYEELDDFVLRLQKIVRNANAAMKLHYPDHHAVLSDIIETKAVKRLLQIVPLEYRAELKRLKVKTLEESLNQLQPWLEEDREDRYLEPPRSSSRYDNRNRDSDDRERDSRDPRESRPRERIYEKIAVIRRKTDTFGLEIGTEIISFLTAPDLAATTLGKGTTGLTGRTSGNIAIRR